MNIRVFLTSLLLLGLLSCYKREIEFGNDLADSHTRVLVIDTVTPILSTYVLDSFPTSGNNIMEVGRYKDPYLGTISSNTYFQLTVPSSVATNFPDGAVYDSAVLIMKSNGYYYGDTSKPVTFIARELYYQPDYTYATSVFNTSTVSVLPGQLGSTTKALSPGRRDSITIRFPDDKGRDFFNKLKSNAVEIQNETNFLDYFKGISISPGPNDSSAMYAFATDSSVKLALYYHVTNPFPVQSSFVFTVTRPTYQFNHITADRTGTFLQPHTTGQREFFASEANPIGATQSGTGTLLKIKFPSLRDLLKLNELVRLLDAQIILKPVETTFDPYLFKLSPRLYLATTDATNSIGYAIADSTAQSTLYGYPFVDQIYHINSNYSFPVTSYINSLLQTGNSGESGFFVLEEDPAHSTQFNRTIFGSSTNRLYKAQLVLTLLTVN